MSLSLSSLLAGCFLPEDSPDVFGAEDAENDWGGQAECLGEDGESGPAGMDISGIDVLPVAGESEITVRFWEDHKAYMDSLVAMGMPKPRLGLQIKKTDGSLIDARLITDPNDPLFCRFKVSDDRVSVDTRFSEEGHLRLTFGLKTSEIDMVEVDSFNLDTGPNGQTFCDNAFATNPR